MTCALCNAEVPPSRSGKYSHLRPSGELCVGNRVIHKTKAPRRHVKCAGPTDRQRQILVYIETSETCPTLREIADALDTASTNGITDHLKSLERKGYIRTGERGKTRSVTVLRSGLPVLALADLIAARAEARIATASTEERDAVRRDVVERLTKGFVSARAAE